MTTMFVTNLLQRFHFTPDVLRETSKLFPGFLCLVSWNRPNVHVPHMLIKTSQLLTFHVHTDGAYCFPTQREIQK